VGNDTIAIFWFVLTPNHHDERTIVLVNFSFFYEDAWFTNQFEAN
jgi:hypothetical protein